MQKKLLMLVLAIIGIFALTGCWPGEIGVETVFENKAGAGTRTIVLDVMDDTLSQTAIPNPDDPDGTEDKGAVVNDKHITGGLSAIQTWLENNAPNFITVKPMRVEGYHRYFTLEYKFDDFDDFLTKYETLVNLSPTMSWSDFDATEKPTWTVSGNTATFKESKAIFEASIDWAIDGIYNSIYDAADLTGFVTKADISVFANYSVKVGDQTFEELQHYDPDAVDNEGTGKMIFVESEDFELTGTYPSNVLTIVLIAAAIVAVAAGGVIGFMMLKKKPV